MIRFRDLSIGKKLTMILAGTSATAVLFACLALYLLILQHYQSSYKNDLRGLAIVVGHNCQVALAFNVPEDAENILSSLHSRTSIAYATIFDVNGNVFASYNRDAKAQNSPAKISFDGLFDAQPPGYLQVNDVITVNNNRIGTVQIVDDLRGLQRFKRLAVFSLAAAIVLACIITILLISLLRGVIIRPISSLAVLAGKVSQTHDFSLRAEKFGNDESGFLVDSFNAMLQQIELRNTSLQESERRFRTLIDQGVDAFFLYDMNGKFIDVNQQACDSLGYDREELLIRQVEDIEETLLNDTHREKLWDRLATSSPLTVEGVYRRKDGTTFPVEIRSGLLRLDKQPFIMALARDISERRKAEEEKRLLENQLQQAQKMESIGTLAGGIAHDFNNILFPIFGYIELAMAKFPQDEELSDYLKQMYRAANRAKELVQQILTFSRSGTEYRSSIQPQPIVKEALKLLRASIPSTIEIHQQIAGNCGFIVANPIHIHQILMNLCTNAYQAMRETGGTLSVSLQPFLAEEDSAPVVDNNLPPGRYVRLEVSDTGPGIDQQTMGRIFEPYFTTKPIGEGTGMGLSMVHGIVESYGGHIIVQSKPGVHTVFTLYFPLAQSAVLTETESMEVMPTGTERILIVDDEIDVVDLMTQLLESLGYDVTSFLDPFVALQTFQNHPNDFDLVITDLTMPKKTGYQLAKELMAIRAGIPIVMCTGYSEMFDEEKAKSIGVNEYLLKPFTLAQIALAIRRSLDSSM